MEVPTTPMPPLREVTGEIVYLNELRSTGLIRQPVYNQLNKEQKFVYEAEAEVYRQNGSRPPIMDEYEQYDYANNAVVRDSHALADILLEYQHPENVDHHREAFISPYELEEVVDILHLSRAAELLAEPDEQLALESDGMLRPTLDVRKQSLVPESVYVQVWGRDTERIVFTNNEDEPYEYPKHSLLYPSGEMEKLRQIAITMNYSHDQAGAVSESIALRMNGGRLQLARSVWMAAYESERSYSGHHSKVLEDVSDADILEFTEAVARIVGDEPTPVWWDKQGHESTSV